MRDPHVVVLIYDATLRPIISAVERAEMCAIGRELVDQITDQRGVPDVALAVDAEAVAVVAVAFPVDAVRSRQRLRRVPAQQRPRRPDDAVLINQPAVAAAADGARGA